MMNFHMLFEQSGTFRDVFKSHNHNSYCYDIQNEYGKTDFQIDLFKEIENEYNNITNSEDYTTIFSNMTSENDFIIAFFPCTYFSSMNERQFRMLYGQKEPIINNDSLNRTIQRIKKRAYFFEIFNKFCFICSQKKIKTIIENPAGSSGKNGNGQANYLYHYSAWRPKYIESDRTKFGDKFKKPTLYFAINFELKEQFIMYDKEYYTKTIINSGCNNRERSEITPRYAHNFYKRFIENNV